MLFTGLFVCLFYSCSDIVDGSVESQEMGSSGESSSDFEISSDYETEL